MSKVLTGKQFHDKYKDKVFVKLTNKDEIHNDFKFKTGLNKDILPFYPTGECQPGGIYFTDKDKLSMWLYYSTQPMYYSRDVKLPDDAWVYEETDKFKADKMILGEREIISEMLIWKDEDMCMKTVKNSVLVLRYISKQTGEICLEAVKQDGLALFYVREQTEEICLEAVKQNGGALCYVREQTPEICVEAVKQNGGALCYVKEQTREICLEAVKQNGYALQHVRKQTSEICLEAVRNNDLALQFVKEVFKHMCLTSLNKK